MKNTAKDSKIDISYKPIGQFEDTRFEKIHNVILSFAARHYCNMLKRFFYSYFIRDFGISSIELVLGKILLLFGITFGFLAWYESSITGIPATAGTVILSALPIILGSQLLIAFLNFDTKNIPTKPLNRHSP